MHAIARATIAAPRHAAWMVDSTPQDIAVSKLMRARRGVARMLAQGAMTHAAYSRVLRDARAAVRQLSPQTNVASPLYGQMSAAIGTTLAAIGSLQAAWGASAIDNGAGQTAQYASLRAARRLLGSAARSAATGTDTF